jgi:hypothetical protein
LVVAGLTAITIHLVAAALVEIFQIHLLIEVVVAEEFRH